MNIKETIAIINRMQTDGIIGRHAIGGAVGATFYLEPVTTLDVDIFIGFQTEPGQLIINLRPIHDYLTARGCSVEAEYIVIAGWPVQFLPPGTPLVEEALREAVEHDVDGMPVRVFSAEHLCAIALEVGRAKDKARVLQFVEVGALDAARFQSIVARHNLTARWQQFERQFLRDQP
ncbi:MAG: hypothetical protein ACREIA_02870 [Opitutaceae bacterium]